MSETPCALMCEFTLRDVYSPRFEAASIPLMHDLQIAYLEARPGSAAHASTIQAETPLTENLPEGDSDAAITLTISMEPPLIEPIIYELPMLEPGEVLRLPDPELKWLVEPDAYTAGIVNVHCHVGRANTQGMNFDRTFTLLDPDVYPGSQEAAELLLTFVEPEHRYVQSLVVQSVRNASKSFKGYRQELREVLHDCDQIYQMLRRERIIYTFPPQEERSKTPVKQQGPRVTKIPQHVIRTLDVLAQQHLATSLELAILYASCLEAMGLHPVFIPMKDDVLVGAFTKPVFSTMLLHDHLEQLRAWTHESEPSCFVIEASMLAGNGRQIDFEEAIQNGRRRLLETQQIVGVFDLKRARDLGLKPWRRDEGILEVHETSKGIHLQESHLRSLHVLAPENLWLQVLTTSIPTTLQRGAQPREAWNRVDDTRVQTIVSGQPVHYDSGLLLTSLMGWERPLGAIQIYDVRSSKLQTAIHQQDHDREGLPVVSSALTPDELHDFVTKLDREQSIRMHRGEPIDLWLVLGAIAWLDDSNGTPEDRARLTPLILIPAAIQYHPEGYALRYQTTEARLHPDLPDLFLKLGLAPDLSERLEACLPTPDLPHLAYRDALQWVERDLDLHHETAHAMDIMLLSHSPVSRLSEAWTALEAGDAGEVPADIEELEGELSAWKISEVLPPILADALDHESLAISQKLMNEPQVILDAPVGSARIPVLKQIIAEGILRDDTTVLAVTRQGLADAWKEALRSMGIEDLVLDLTPQHLTAKDVSDQFERMLDLPLMTQEVDYQARLNKWQHLYSAWEALTHWLATPDAHGQTPNALLEARPEQKLKAPKLIWPTDMTGVPVASGEDGSHSQALEVVSTWVEAMRELRAASMEAHTPIRLLSDVTESFPWRMLRAHSSTMEAPAEEIVERFHRTIYPLQTVYQDLAALLELPQDPSGWLMQNLAGLARTVEQKGFVDAVWFDLTSTDQLRVELQKLIEADTELEAISQELPEVFATFPKETPELEAPAEMLYQWDAAELQPAFSRWRVQRKLKRVLVSYAKQYGEHKNEAVKPWLKSPNVLLRRLAELDKHRAEKKALEEKLAPYLSTLTRKGYEEAVEQSHIWQRLRTDLSALYRDEANQMTTVNQRLPQIMHDRKRFEREVMPKLKQFLGYSEHFVQSNRAWTLWTGSPLSEDERRLSEVTKVVDVLYEDRARVSVWTAWHDADLRMEALKLQDLSAQMLRSDADALDELKDAAARSLYDAKLRNALHVAELPWREPKDLPDLSEMMVDLDDAANALVAGAGRKMHEAISRILPERVLRWTQDRSMDRLSSLLREHGRGRTLTSFMDETATFALGLFPVILVSAETLSERWNAELPPVERLIVDGADTWMSDRLLKQVPHVQTILVGDQHATAFVPGSRPSKDLLISDRTEAPPSLLQHVASQEETPCHALSYLYEGFEDRLVVPRNLEERQGALVSAPLAVHRSRHPIAIRRHRVQSGSSAQHAQAIALLIRQELSILSEQLPEAQTARILTDQEELLLMYPDVLNGIEVEAKPMDDYPEDGVDILIIALLDPEKMPLIHRKHWRSTIHAYLAHARMQVLFMHYDLSQIRAIPVETAGRYTRFEGRSVSYGRQAWQDLLQMALIGSRLQATRLGGSRLEELTPQMRHTNELLRRKIELILSERGHKYIRNMGLGPHRIDLALAGDLRCAILIPSGDPTYDTGHLMAFRHMLLLSGWNVYIPSPWHWRMQTEREIQALIAYLRTLEAKS